MAAHNTSLAADPALMKYYNMHQNRMKYFRWNRRTAGITFAYGFAFPALIGYIAWSTEGKWDFRGKKRGDTVAEW
ncbi:hypothetical protein F5884DRAFT_852174 [Xylogone sp. PMI_703]|nr:hypothetical protein F5884DRAFT_852174 [Xylogone sp. PMI_703]